MAMVLLHGRIKANLLVITAKIRKMEKAKYTTLRES